MMRMDSDQFLDKAALEAMQMFAWIEESMFDENAQMAFKIAAAMVKERKRLMDEQKKTKVSEKFGKLPEVE